MSDSSFDKTDKEMGTFEGARVLCLMPPSTQNTMVIQPSDSQTTYSLI